MRQPRTVRIAAVTSALLLGVALGPARAQEASVAAGQAPAALQAQKGPLVFQQVRNEFVVAPEIKFTEVDNRYGTMIGGYAGLLLDGTFLIGGAGYWLADGEYDRGISYGGIVVGWYMPVGKTVRFGARGLIGAGSGTTSYTYTYTPGDYPYWGHGRQPYPPSDSNEPITQRVIYSTGFFVAEPQASVVLKVADWVSVDASAGYRFVGWSNGFDDHFRGVVGSIAIRFGIQ